MKINRRTALKSLILAAGGLPFVDLKNLFNVGRLCGESLWFQAARSVSRLPRVSR